MFTRSLAKCSLLVATASFGERDGLALSKQREKLTIRFRVESYIYLVFIMMSIA